MGVTRTEIFSVEQNRIADLAKAFSHPARVAILQMLTAKKTCVCGDLVDELELAQATVSQHLKELKRIGIIQGEINPPRVCYCINPVVWEEARVAFDFVLTVCDNAREQCPVYSSNALKIHQSFPDPGHDPNEEALVSFRHVRDMIKEYSREFAANYLSGESEKSLKIENAQPADRVAMIALLQNANLPTEDLPESLAEFVVAKSNGRIVGSAGFERFGTIGLLRSVAVDPAFQKSGIARQMLDTILTNAAKTHLQHLYLITNTADRYFEKLGFRKLDRDSAPTEIQETPQFNGLCPASSTVMKFDIIP